MGALPNEGAPEALIEFWLMLAQVVLETSRPFATCLL
jgi:hypothetical protein